MSVASPVIDYLDLATKHIYLLAGCREYHPVEDIYIEVRNVRRTDESMRPFDVPVTAAGAVPKGGGKYTPRYAIFNNGWRVVPEDTSHSLHITGEQITSEGTSGEACMDLTGLSVGVSVFIAYDPPAAEIIRDEESLSAIHHMAFNDQIIYDSEGSNTGTEFPAGTSAEPCSVIADAETIAQREFISRGRIKKDIHLTIANPHDGATFIGSGVDITTITIDTDAIIQNCTFHTSNITGKLSGHARAYDCALTNLTGLHGKFRDCMLSPGRLTLGTGTTHFIDCDSGVPGTGTCYIDYNGAGASAAFRGFKGGTLHTNKTGPESVSIDLLSGQVKLDLAGDFGDSGVVNGDMVVRGKGKVIDATTGEFLYSGTYGNFTLLNETSQALESAEVLLESFTAGFEEGTVGHALGDISYTDKFIFIDTSAVTNGNGKSSSPFNVVADAVDFAESVGWKKLIFLADATLERTLKNFTVEGIGLPTIDINGQNVDKSEFLKVGLTGEQVGSITAREVVLLGNLTGANGVYKESGLAGTISAAEGANITLASVSSLFTSSITPNIIDLGAATTTVLLNVRKLSGALLIKNVNTSTKVATIEFSGGKIELDSSNTAGAIGIAGIPDTAITDNSNGSNVLIVGVFPGADTIANAVLDEVA